MGAAGSGVGKEASFVGFAAGRCGKEGGWYIGAAAWFAGAASGSFQSGGKGGCGAQAGWSRRNRNYNRAKSGGGGFPCGAEGEGCIGCFSGGDAVYRREGDGEGETGCSGAGKHVYPAGRTGESGAGGTDG